MGSKQSPTGVSRGSRQVLRWRALAAGGAVAALTLLSVSSAVAQNTSPHPVRSSRALVRVHRKAAVHKKIKQLTVATLDGDPPFSFFKGKTLKGVDADLLQAIGKELGVRFHYVNIPFPGQLPGLIDGRWVMIADSIGDTVARQSEARFIDYTRDGLGIIVQKGNPEHITKEKDLCGKSVTVLAGSDNLAALQAISNSCQQPIDMSLTSSTQEMDLAVVAGRADFAASSYPFESYEISHAHGGPLAKLQVSKVPLVSPAIDGFAVKKSNKSLARKVRSALAGLIKSGEYQRLMKKWGLSQLRLAKAYINRPNQPVIK